MSNLLAHDARGVKKRIDKANALLFNNLSESIPELEEGLREMIAQVQEDECALYHRLGVSDYNGFLDRVEGTKISELDCLLSNGTIVKYYIKNYSFPRVDNQEMAIDYLRQLVELNLDKIVPELINGASEQVEDITEDALQYIRASFKKSNSRLRYFGKGKSKVGIAKIRFSLNRKMENGVVKTFVDAQLIDNNARIGSQLLGKIINTLGPNRVVSVAFPSRVLFQKDVERIVLEKIPHSWKEAVAYVMKEGGIEISRSYAGLVGYLGELRSLAVLYRLFGKSIVATGGMQNILSANREEIPIDAAVRQGLNYFGFQVKNYTLSEGKASFSGSMSTANFVAKRLCLTGTAQEVLEDLLGVYQFNQKFVSNKLVERFEKKEMTTEQYASQIYSVAAASVQKLTGLFESRLGNILRVGYKFQVGNSGLFGSPKMYYNSFFFIEKRYVPSSVILQEILEQLLSSKPQSYANLSYNIKNAPGITLENYYSKLPNKSDVLSKQWIDYNIVLDVDKLVERAKKRI